MQRLAICWSTLAILVLSVLQTPAYASIVLDSTRVIYPAQDRSVSVKLSNKGEQPVVIQSWLDEGDIAKKPSQIKTPFLLMPPMIRVDPGKRQTLRLIYTGEPLPQDRESVYYLNVLEIPPKAAAIEGKNVLQLALRTRIKVFYRPLGLADAADSAPQQLIWTLVRDEQGWMLECRNPTAYHVSMATVSLSDTGQSSSLGSGMVAPGQTIRFALKGRDRPPEQADVNFTVVDDYGAIRAHKGLMAR